MLIYEPLSENNLEEAINLVSSVFPNEENINDEPLVAYKASLYREKYSDFIKRHELDILK